MNGKNRPGGAVRVHSGLSVLTPSKSCGSEKQHEVAYEKRETPSVWQGKNATVLPVRKTDQFGWIGCGGVVDEDGNSVGISAVECCVKPCNSFESAEYRDKKLFIAGI